jgi:uncharacterized metal-binding protein
MNTNENLLASGPATDASGPARGLVESKPLPKPIVYACSGCSDAGELADSVARALARTGLAEMSCLAGIGGRVKSLMNKAERAESILVIDGCPLNCARNTLQLAGFEEFQHLELHRLGFRKGSCPPSPERVAAGTEAASRMIQNVAPIAVAK